MILAAYPTNDIYMRGDGKFLGFALLGRRRLASARVGVGRSWVVLWHERVSFCEVTRWRYSEDSVVYLETRARDREIRSG